MPDILTGLGARYRKRTLTPPTAAYSSGATVSIPLDRSFFQRKVMLRASGAITIAGAPITSLLNDAPTQYVSQIQLIADGRRVIWTLSGNDAYRLSHIMEGKAGELAAPALTVGAARAWAFSCILHNEAIRTAFPGMSAFDCRPYELLELRITFGSPTAIVLVLGGATVTMDAGAIVEVQQVATTEGEDEIGFTRLLSNTTVAISAAQTNLAVTLPRMGLLHGVLIRCVVDSNNADTVINNIGLRSDNSFLHADRLTWATLQRQNVIDYALDSGTIGAAITGIAFLDLTDDGDPSSMLMVNDLNVLDLLLDVAAPGAARSVVLTPVYFEPLV